MKEIIQLSPEVGVPLLKFLWRWKLVSTAALTTRFFSHLKHPFSGYNYLSRLRDAGYVESHPVEKGDGLFWSMGRAGYDAIRRDELPELKESGFKSEAKLHDWLTSAFHIGEWLVTGPAGVQVCSEQELRRLEPEHYPAWVPRDVGHRPDGFWHRIDRGEVRTIALEMELNRKRAAAYQGIGSYYGSAVQVGRVLWVVPTLTDAKSIAALLNEAPGARPQMHSFTLVDSFRKKGWSALIEVGPGQGYSVQSYLLMALGIEPDTFVIPEPFRGTTMELLETRIKRFRTVP